MQKKGHFFLLLVTVIPSMIFCYAISEKGQMHENDIPPRYQWDENSGYCGEVSLISAGLFYGQYASQYDVRALAIGSLPQNQGQLLLGKNDQTAASLMHLNVIEYNTVAEQDTDDFLAWVKQNVVKGYPVAIGIYTNEYLFYGDTDPDAGDAEYDHIVPVTGIGSSHDLSDPNYYSDDTLYFSDNGLWGSATNPPYAFSYSFGAFQASREQANATNGPVYSLSNDASNYGVAITGVMDLNGDTLPVRVDTNLNYEKPEIAKGSNERPPSMPLTLTITVSDLEPNVEYNLYRYTNFSSVPNSEFNAHAKDASQNWKIQIPSGSTYVMTQQINSNEIAVYRAVKASAP
jgi:hypothetical protein